MKRQAIAIDGPSASGKSTIARLLADRLHMDYLDTGAMYRAITLFALESGVDPENEEEVNRLLDRVEITFNDGDILVNGKVCTREIRTDEVTRAVSPVSSYKKVREKMVDQQRKIAGDRPVILDGRDIGTVVLPDALLKIFLTASPEVRAQRRLKDDKSSSTMDYQALLVSIKKRDDFDSHRAISPLRPAEDAILIDSSDMTIDQVLEKIQGLWEEKQCTL
ncbi:(d)CMP kinase [Kallipyga massiliensis]|uniref:(d)CMP kinase n=1 Tax=Kallipyga massiliensis TaxID=1472764 RepID=UPI0004B4349A|nr:(d)CMP kinase [Kallipyga massiliensis]